MGQKQGVVLKRAVMVVGGPLIDQQVEPAVLAPALELVPGAGVSVG